MSYNIIEKNNKSDSKITEWKTIGVRIKIIELANQPSDQFLKFAESVFTNNKKDSQHNPSFKSCLLRIPSTINSKNGSEVKTIKRFDENKIASIDDKLLREFRLD